MVTTCKAKNMLTWITTLTDSTHQGERREESQLDATECFIALIICSTCFGHLYARHRFFVHRRIVISSVLQVAIQKFKDIQNYNFACCFVWVWNLVTDIEGGKEAEGVWEYGIEENIYT